MNILTQITALGLFKATELQHIYRTEMTDLYWEMPEDQMWWTPLHQVIWEDLIQKPILRLRRELDTEGMWDAADYLSSLENDLATQLNNWETPPMAELFRNHGVEWLRQYAIDLYPEITEEIEEEAYSMSVGSWSFMKIEYLLKNHPKKILKMLEEEETAKEYLTKLQNQAEQMYQTHLAQLKSGLSQDEQEKYQTMNELMAKEKVVYSLICTQTTN